MTVHGLNKFKILDNNIVSVYLKSNLCILINLEDFEKIKSYKWLYSKKSSKKFNNKACAYTVINGKDVRLHRFLFNLRFNEKVRHINGNCLDNRRSNIQIIKQNFLNSIEIIENRKTVKIELDHGYYTYVDMSDWKSICRKYVWGTHEISIRPNSKYVRTVINTDRGQKCILLHRLLMKAKRKQRVIHLDGDNFNNRRSNLKILE